MTNPPLLVYDADCGFCRWCVERGRGLLGRFPDVTGFQCADLASLGLSHAQVEKSIYLWSPGRPLRHGADAVAAIFLAQRSFGWRLIGGLLSVAPFSWLAAAAYQGVARYRHRLPGGAAGCRVPDGPGDEPGATPLAGHG